MTKNVFRLMAFAAAAVLTVSLASCGDDEKVIPSYEVTPSFTLPSDLDVSDITNLTLVFDNGVTKQTVHVDDQPAVSVVKTRATISLTALKLVQGTYTITANGKIKDEATGYVQGQTTADLYTDQKINLTLEKYYQSALIFKSIYNTGSVMGLVTDGYFEIVNNSDEVQYLDQLIISSPMGQKVENAWQANGLAHLYNPGQGSVIAFPGNGTDYPLQPGQSVLVANDATNHKLAYGENESKKDDYALAPDLTNADWEIYLDYSADVDYPVKNMDVVWYNNKYMKMFGFGVAGRGMVLAKLPEGVTPQAFAASEDYLMYQPGSSSTYMNYLCIPSNYVLDAVDLIDPEASEFYPAFLPKDDAHPAKASDKYTGQCVRRKVIKIENGRPYYQDTNNSENDFLRNQPLTPGVTPTEVD